MPALVPERCRLNASPSSSTCTVVKMPEARRLTGCYDVQGERVGLVGANGQGKSTLVKLMLGELRPKSGTALQHPQARVGVFAQSNVENLVQGKGQLTALKHMKALFPEGERLPMHAEYASKTWSQCPDQILAYCRE